MKNNEAAIRLYYEMNSGQISWDINFDLRAFWDKGIAQWGDEFVEVMTLMGNEATDKLIASGFYESGIYAT